MALQRNLPLGVLHNSYNSKTTLASFCNFPLFFGSFFLFSPTINVVAITKNCQDKSEAWDKPKFRIFKFLSMKRIELLFFLCILLCTQSCKKDLSNSTNQSVSEIEFNVSTNPYNYIGTLHNDLLDDLYVNKEYFESIDDVITEAKVYYNFNAVENEIISCIEDVQLNMDENPYKLLSLSVEDLYLQNKFSSNTKLRLNQFASIIENSLILIDTASINEYLSNAEMGIIINSIISEMESLETVCMSDTNIPENEKLVVLSTISVGKNSLAYWHQVLTNENHPYHNDLVSFSGSYKTNGLNIKKFLQGLLIVGSADAVGALIGAVGGMLPTNIAICDGILSTITAIGLLT